MFKTPKIVVVSGPKFCGKSTLCNEYAKSTTTLKTSNAINLAKADPASALVGANPHLVDEWQKAPEIWINYFLKIFSLYATKVLSIALDETRINDNAALSHLSPKVKLFLDFLRKHRIELFTPIEMSKKVNVTNRTIINWCIELSNNGFIEPIIVNKRVRQYRLLN